MQPGFNYTGSISDLSAELKYERYSVAIFLELYFSCIDFAMLCCFLVFRFDNVFSIAFAIAFSFPTGTSVPYSSLFKISAGPVGPASP